MKTLLTLVGITCLLCACQTQTKKAPIAAKVADTTTKNGTIVAALNEPSKQIADAAIIMARTQVPVLCYHHIRDLKPGDGENMRSYSVTPAGFAEQMKALADSGYHAVLPDQLYNYLAFGDPLPDKPVMLTFDDTDLEQYTIGATEMAKHGFKGVFFIMTISINKPRYMSKEQIKDLADKGNEVACHTWDHHMVTKYTGNDWDIQLVKPRKTIEDIIGKSVNYFAYPYGLWNEAAIPEIKKRNYKLAFILSTKRDSTQPLYTVRRMIVPSQWSTSGMFKAMRSTFHL